MGRPKSERPKEYGVMVRFEVEVGRVLTERAMALTVSVPELVRRLVMDGIGEEAPERSQASGMVPSGRKAAKRPANKEDDEYSEEVEKIAAKLAQAKEKASEKRAQSRKWLCGCGSVNFGDTCLRCRTVRSDE